MLLWGEAEAEGVIGGQPVARHLPYTSHIGINRILIRAAECQYAATST